MSLQTAYPVPPGAFNVANFVAFGVVMEIDTSGGSSSDVDLSIGANDFYCISVTARGYMASSVQLHEQRDLSDVLKVNIKRNDGVSYTGAPIDINALNRISVSNPLWRGWVITRNEKLICTAYHIALGTSALATNFPMRVELTLTGYKYLGA